MKKKLIANSSFCLSLVLLCMPLTAFSDTAQVNELENAQAVTEHHRDLLVTIPSDMEYAWYTGAWKTLNIPIDPQVTNGFLDIAARQMHTQDPPILLDEQDLPILTTDSVRELLNGTQNYSASILDSGETRLAGNAAAYIDVLFYDDTEEEGSNWKAKVIRTVYEGFAYDVMYAAPAQDYETYLSAAASITAMLKFDTRENEMETITLGDMTLDYPVRNMSAYGTDTSFEISVLITGIDSQFRAQLDNSKIYEEGFLDNIHWLNLHLLSLTEEEESSTELSREEISFHGKRALRVVYHTDHSIFHTSKYVEAIVFTYNGGLFSLISQDHKGEEARLHEFAQPIIDSVRFDENAPPAVAAPTTDTVRWINYANAILTLSNGGDVELYGGVRSNSEIQKMVRNGLQQSWGITNKDSMDAALTRLRESGHRANFADIIAGSHGLFGLEDKDFALAMQNETEMLRKLKEYLEERIRLLNAIDSPLLSELIEREMAELAELESALDAMDSAAVQLFFKNMNRTFRDAGENALLAWDYVRAINLIGHGYLVGFFSFEEALDLSLEFAKELQQAFPSWDALYRDYLDGFAFWNFGDENDPTTENNKRAELVKGLMLLSRGPSSFAYDTPLTADWPDPPEMIEVEFASSVRDMIAPIDLHGRPDKTPFNAGDTVEFPLTADMFNWINMDALTINTAMLYGWDVITNYENAPVHPSILINSGVAVAFESKAPQIIRSVDITETAYPYPGFPDLRTACVKVVFADDFADLHKQEFEVTLYLTLEGERIPLSEISLAGTLFDHEADILATKQLVISVRIVLASFFAVVIACIMFFGYRRKKQLAHWQALWSESDIPEGQDESK